jgi:5-methylcytosine-specific restriction enzyme subunit McrC
VLLKDTLRAVSRANEFLRRVEARTATAIQAGDSLIIRFGQERFHSSQDQIFIKCEGTLAERLLIRTGNVIGQIQGMQDGYQLSLVVSSRFGELFLRRMITLSEGFIELDDLGGAPLGGMSEWLLVYLWKVRLKQAFAAGIPKEYVSRVGRLPMVRGNLDINSLVRMPDDIGKYTCIWREHSFDNPVTRLIYSAFQALYRRETVENLLSETHREKSAFGEACGGRVVRNRIGRARRSQTPYFAAYDEVADLSQKILLNESADIALEEDEFSGFLFDVSLLFENYIRKLLSDSGLWLEPKEKDPISYPTGRHSSRPLLPDITLHGKRSTLILDTKYKWWEEHYGVSREDAFQVITYASSYRSKYPRHPVLGYGFVFPKAEPNRHIAAPIERMFSELGMCFYVFFINTSEAAAYEKVEASFVAEIANTLIVLDEAI